MADGGVSLYLAVAALAAAGYAEYEGGQIQSAQLKHEAYQEKLAGQSQEVIRKQKLLKALASRNVGSAAGNTALEGSDIALVNKDFEDYSLDSLSAQATTAGRRMLLRTAGTNAGRLGTVNAVATVLQGASLMSFGGGGKTPGAGPLDGGK